MPEPEQNSESLVQTEISKSLFELLGRHAKQLEGWLEEYGPKEKLPEWVLMAEDRLCSPYFGWLEDIDESSPSLKNLGKLVGGLKFACENVLKIEPLLALHRKLGTLKEAKKRLRPLRLIIRGINRSDTIIRRKVEEYPSYETQPFHEGFSAALKHNHVDCAT